MKVAKFQFALQTANSYGLPAFKGSTFRGKFGHVLKRTICVKQQRYCPDCELRGQCAYPYLFESFNEKGQNVPRPFIIEPPLTKKRHFLKDEWMYLQLILVGKAIDYLPFFVYCFDLMGQEGIGMDHGRYRVVSGRALDTSGEQVPIYDGDSKQLLNRFPIIDLDAFRGTLQNRVTLDFYTPAQIRIKGKTCYRITFPVLLKNIIRRYQSLRYYHSNGEKERYEIDWAAAEKVRVVSADLNEQHFKRYSNRQKRPVRLDGFTGKITFEGDLSPFLPWLKIGEFLHVGKGAVFGMGGYWMEDKMIEYKQTF